jgi:hypothetical protein
VEEYNVLTMNKETITKEELQRQVVDFWIQDGIIFTDQQLDEREQLKQGIYSKPHWTYEYDWKKDTKLQPWAKEVLESEEKMILQVYSEGYEVTVISRDTQKTYIVEKRVREK